MDDAYKPSAPLLSQQQHVAQGTPPPPPTTTTTTLPAPSHGTNGAAMLAASSGYPAANYGAVNNHQQQVAFYPGVIAAPPQLVAPVYAYPAHPRSAHAAPTWASGVFDCCSDVETCLTPFGVLYGRTESIVNGPGSPFFTVPCCVFTMGLQVPETCPIAACLGSCMCLGPQRTKLRQKYGIPEGSWGDVCETCFCAPCVVCQHARELKMRGVFVPQQYNGSLAPLPITTITR
ncbi:hypothetical protein PPROV_000188000 [Pycnococcus provasolii]|uniref:Uncharacterized protein n=1 Tax=Pycnococcus provasolii TaxID=41880 RepID=A0A830H807_9CHLO|nr:hypothetical protein PPROV_000188000 [Pycnococcus provasolii]